MTFRWLWVWWSSASATAKVSIRGGAKYDGGSLNAFHNVVCNKWNRSPWLCYKPLYPQLLLHLGAGKHLPGTLSGSLAEGLGMWFLFFRLVSLLNSKQLTCALNEWKATGTFVICANISKLWTRRSEQDLNMTPSPLTFFVISQLTGPPICTECYSCNGRRQRCDGKAVARGKRHMKSSGVVGGSDHTVRIQMHQKPLRFVHLMKDLTVCWLISHDQPPNS